MKFKTTQDSSCSQISDSIIIYEQNTDTEQCETTSNTLHIDDETIPIPSDDTHAGTKYSATIQCNSEGASVAKCDKNITTEVDSKLISHGVFIAEYLHLQKVKCNCLRSKNFKGTVMCPDPCQMSYWLC